MVHVLGLRYPPPPHPVFEVRGLFVCVAARRNGYRTVATAAKDTAQSVNVFFVVTLTHVLVVVVGVNPFRPR